MSYRTNKAQQDLLNQFLSGHGVQLSEETLDKLYQFADLVVDTKEYGNLISAKDSEKFLSRHIADSLVPFVFLGKEIPDQVGNDNATRDCFGDSRLAMTTLMTNNY